ncbi:MAG TPA: phosphatase PAP2 family protein [Candidatus Binatia bacterium]|nr:phosphatase PAP2 family protein [Candidatus Binatia bacterium]
MARRVAALAALLVACATISASADQHFYYLNPAQIDLTVYLPPPPDLGSAQELADEQQVAAAVASRSKAQVSTAEEDAQRTVFFFEPSIGPGFAPDRLPVTARFFERVGSDVKKLVDLAKVYWERPRPSGAEKRRGSYPSGHAAFAASSAILLGELLPAKRDAVFAQARTFAENRILLGLHYPSDVASGWTAGTLAVFDMMHDRAFQRDFAAVKAELRRAKL